MKKNNQKGFTLIELLVVIAIIGLLSTLAVVSLNNARTKSRDARRIADVKQIQTALELYFTDNAGYPAAPAAAVCTDAQGVAGILGEIEGCSLSGAGVTAPSATTGTTYMGIIPTNPLPNGTSYILTQDGTGDSYSLVYNLEQITAGVALGGHTATPSGIVDD